MATETRYAASVASGSTSGSGNATGASDGTFTTDTNNTDWTCAWNMDALTTGALTTGTNNQQVDVVTRHDSGNNPDYVLKVYEGGSLVYTSGTTTVSSLTSQTDTFYWTSSGTDGSNIDIELVVNAVGGSPSNRSTVQLDSITWTADYTTVVAYSGGTSPLASTVSLSSDGTYDYQGAASLAVTASLSASPLIVEYDGGASATPVEVFIFAAGSVNTSTNTTTHRAHGGGVVVSPSTTTSHNLPTGTATGDLTIYWSAQKDYDDAVTSASWGTQDISIAAGSTASSGSLTGSTRMDAWSYVWPSTPSGSNTLTRGTSYTIATTCAESVYSTSGKIYYDVVGATDLDGAGLTLSATAGSVLEFKTGDRYVVTIATVGAYPASATLTVPGCVVGSGTTKHQSFSSTDPDLGWYSMTGTITAGTATGVPSVSGSIFSGYGASTASAAIYLIRDGAQVSYGAPAELLTVQTSASGTVAVAVTGAASDVASTVSLSASGLVTITAAADLTAQSAATAAASVIVDASSSLTAESSLSAAADVVISGASALTAESDATASAVMTAVAASDLVGESALTAAGVMQAVAASALTAESGLAANAVTVVVASSSLTGESSLSATGLMTAVGSSALTGESALTASGTIIPGTGPTADLTFESSLSATGLMTALGSCDLAAESAATAAGVVVAIASAALTSESSSTSSAVVVKVASSALTGESELTSAGVQVAPASVDLVAESSLSATAIQAHASAVDLVAESALPVGAIVIKYGASDLAGESSTSATATQVMLVDSLLSAQSSISAIGGVQFLGLASLSVMSQMDQAATVVPLPVVRYSFTTPIYDKWSGKRERSAWGFNHQAGVTILKNGGVYTERLTPTAREVESADVAYVGGYTYTVSEAEGLALIAAGYSPTLL